MGTCSRASGGVSRARSTPSLAIVTRMSSSLKVSSTVSQSTGASGRVFPDATEYQFDLSVSKARTATLRKPVQISDRALALSEVQRRRLVTCPAFLGVPLCPTLWHWLVHINTGPRNSQGRPSHSGCQAIHARKFFSPSKGEERARIPAEFRARIFDPLGSGGALREGLKTTG